MASTTRSTPADHRGTDRAESDTFTARELPKDARDCLVEKAVNTLLAMGRNRPKLCLTLRNSLVPCTPVAPYVAPLDALSAANEASAARRTAVSVDVPHAKRRVYAGLGTVQKASREWLISKRSEGRRYDLAPRRSDIETEIVMGAMEWLQGSPEGTGHFLVAELVRMCEKEADCSDLVLKKFQKAGYLRLDEQGRLAFHLPHDKSGPSSQPASGAQARVLSLLRDRPPSARPATEAQFLELVQPVCKVWFTVPPARFFEMNLRGIRHRAVEQGKTLKSEPQQSQETETKSDSLMETEFAIGVYPGENDVREHISITPGGLTGIDVSVIGQVNTPRKKLETPSRQRQDNAYRMRAVGQTKGLSEFFTQRLTVAVRSCNAVLVPASDEEKKAIVSKVARWISSIHGGSTCNDQPAQQHTVPKLQQELANMCVGKMQRLAPSTISDLLQRAGHISIGGDGEVGYHLPANRGARDNASKSAPHTWQQRTVESAVKSCKFSSLLRKAFPRRKTKDARGIPDKTTPSAQGYQSDVAALPPDNENTDDDYSYDYNPDDYGYGYDILDDGLDCYDPYDDYGDDY